MGVVIGFEQIDAALDVLIAELEKIGPPGTVEPVEIWMREHGFDPDGVRHAAMHAVLAAPAPARPEALAAWIQGFTIGWTLGRSE